MNVRKAYYRFVRLGLGFILKTLGIDDTAHSASLILRKLIYRESLTVHSYPASIEKQVFFIFANRMLIDSESALLLAKNGLYGSGYALVAVMLRTFTMYASLLADKTRLNDFWNEDKDTYQMDQKFQSSFNESVARSLAKDKFGQEAFNKDEFEKLLHGSCYAIRKYYSKKQIRSDGKSAPLLLFKSFKEETKEIGIKNTVAAILLDFLGIFFTEYENKEHSDLLDYYFVVIRRAQIDTTYYAQKYGQ